MVVESRAPFTHHLNYEQGQAGKEGQSREREQPLWGTCGSTSMENPGEKRQAVNGTWYKMSKVQKESPWAKIRCQQGSGPAGVSGEGSLSSLFQLLGATILATGPLGPPLSSKPAVVAWSFTGNPADTDFPFASLFHLEGFW